MSNAVAARKDERARRKAERMMEKQREAAEHDLPRSMRPSPITKTITVIVLVVALIYFLHLLGHHRIHQNTIAADQQQRIVVRRRT